MPPPHSRALIAFLACCCGVAASALAQEAAPPASPPDPPPSSAPAQPPSAAPTPTTPGPGNPDIEPETVVTLRDGQRYTGQLVHRDEDKVILRIGGIITTLQMASVDRVVVLAPVEVRYREMRAAIDDTDVERLLVLADWLRARERFDLALKEVDQALAAEPRHPGALRLRTLIAAQKELVRRAAERRESAQSGPADPAPPKRPVEPDFPLLNAEQINLIKVYEMDLADPPRMLVERDTIRQLIEENAASSLIPPSPEAREQLLRSSPTRIVELMFQLQARNLYPQIKVLDHPRSMQNFRDEIQRGWLGNFCATSECHGGAEAGRLRLAGTRIGTDAAAYTNFLILERYRLADGRPLINYDQPADSVLLQYALPRPGPGEGHPPAPGRLGRDAWRPVLRSTTDRRYQDAIRWIRSMYRPRPNHPIDYTPPEGRVRSGIPADGQAPAAPGTAPPPAPPAEPTPAPAPTGR